jgi:hypothetical protein
MKTIWTETLQRHPRSARSLLLSVVLFTLSGSCLHAQESLNELDNRLTIEWSSVALPLLKTHCGDCHMQTANEGGVNLDDYQDLAKIRMHASTWEQIRGVIRAEAMPPPDQSQITTDQRELLSNWIHRALNEVDCDCAESIPPVTLRRLNQIEYDNTICDLLYLDLKPSKDIGFVSDDVGNGFDNQGEVLTVPPIMLEKYLQAAAYIAKETIETDREQFRKQSFEGSTLSFQENKIVQFRTADGEYSVQIRMRFGDKQPDPCKARIAIDGTTIAEHSVSSKEETYKQDIVLTTGEHSLDVEYVDDEDPDKRGGLSRRLVIESIRVHGPKEGLPAYPIHHDRFVIADPTQKDTPDTEPIGVPEACRRIFDSFLPRAYRRPVTAAEVDAVVSICRNAFESGFSFEESLRYGLQGVLVSPNFLFRNETAKSEMAKSGTASANASLSSHEIAVRLSYFLWSTMPDAALSELASQDRLRDPSVLLEQVDRMLDSTKSDAMVSGFFGQWLGLRNLFKIDIDREKFPGWNDRLRNALVKETETFCGHLLRKGSFQDVTDATYTFVNPRLADFYGLLFDGREPSEMYRRNPNRKGNNERRQGLYEEENRWIQVELGSQRRGLLTHASVLALTSNPTRSSPVKRGKWILENVLGDPPPSAPPNVPALESAVHAPDASLRERLEIHRSNPSCAGCHKLMDPIGLGLENFDTIGRWRDKDEQGSIDSRGQLVNGQQFSGPAELVALLSSKQEQILENAARRMFVYALGRGIQRQDKCDIDRMIHFTRENGSSVRSMVKGVVLSRAFMQYQY